MKLPAPSPLDAHLGYWLRFVSNQVSGAFSEKLAGRGVTVMEWVALRELYDQPALVPSLLAERLGMTRGGVSKLAERLAARGLITRSADKADKRFSDLALTGEGAHWSRSWPIWPTATTRNSSASWARG
ncbi:MAG: helix-turn-helix domain-containing protein [Caulobacteraceae bacterium]